MSTRKHRKFVAKPMGDEPVTKLPGVGKVLGKRLAKVGFDKAYVVLGQFLVLKKDPQAFQEWMKDTCLANAKESLNCWQCLMDWCEVFD